MLAAPGCRSGWCARRSRRRRSGRACGCRRPRDRWATCRRASEPSPQSGSVSNTQWAAVSTITGVTSEPPQKTRVEVVVGPPFENRVWSRTSAACHGMVGGGRGRPADDAAARRSAAALPTAPAATGPLAWRWVARVDQVRVGARQRGQRPAPRPAASAPTIAPRAIPRPALPPVPSLIGTILGAARGRCQGRVDEPPCGDRQPIATMRSIGSVGALGDLGRDLDLVAACPAASRGPSAA